MKKIFALFLIASAFLCTSSFAQKGKMAMAKQTLMDSLKVSDALADSIVSIRQQTMSEIKTIMSDQSLSQEQKKEKTKPIKQDMKMRLKKILNKEQLEKLQNMEMTMRQNKKDE